MASHKYKLGPVSAYAIAKEHGFVGTEAEWLESLRASDAQVAQYLIEHPEVLQQMNPTKGTVATLSALPSSGNAVNDTYYVQSEKYRVTWTGSQWVQTSMSEADYEGELGNLRSESLIYRGDLDGTTVTPDTVTEIGCWTAAGTVLQQYIGNTPSTLGSRAIFFNLRKPPNDFMQMFITTDGRVYSRYQKKSSFTSTDTANAVQTRVNGLCEVQSVLTETDVYAGRLYNIDSEDFREIANYNVKKYSVTPGDTLRLSGVNPSTGNVLYAVFDENGRELAHMPPGYVQVGRTTYTMTVPNGASYLYVAGHLNTPQSVEVVTIDTDPESIIRKFVAVDDLEQYGMSNLLRHADHPDRTNYNGITSRWNEDGSCTLTGTCTNAVGIYMWGETSPLPSWIKPGETYYISFSGSHVQFSITAFDAYGNTIDSHITRTGSLYTVPERTEAIRIILRVPPISTELNETVTPALLPDIPGKDVLALVPSLVDLPLSVVVTDQGVTVTEGNLRIVLQKNGANSLINFKSAHWDNTQLYYTGTDWIGPYNFAAVNNADGDRLDPSKGVRSSSTTGGNHNIHTGDPAAGTPTARTVSWTAYADGKPVTPGDTVSCSRLLVRWTNRVQAGNTAKLAKDASGYGTGRECLEEHCFAEFCGGGLIRVGVDFSPLEEITMNWYSGLQFAGSAFASDLYIPAYDKRLIGVSYVNDRRNDAVVQTVEAVGALMTLEMHMDRDFGIGANVTDYSYSGGSNGVGDKGYFLLYSYGNDPVAMEAGERYSWRGHYRYYPSAQA